MKDLNKGKDKLREEEFFHLTSCSCY